MSVNITVADLFSNHKELTEKIQREIEPYATCLIGLRKKNTAVEAELAGSATFVHLEDRHFVLTANHVFDKKLKQFEAMGLSLGSFDHNWYEQLDKLRIIHVGVPKNYDTGDGPDLSIIELPPNRVSEIKPHKMFHNLVIAKNKIKDFNCSDESEVIWCVCGCISDWTEDKTPNHNFNQLKDFRSLVGFGGAQPDKSHEEFDYTIAKVVYELGSMLPESFRGLSGGGLWKVPLHQLENGELDNGFPVLAGVAFYQSEVRENTRDIKCHGIRSVYERVVEKLKA